MHATQSWGTAGNRYTCTVLGAAENRHSYSLVLVQNPATNVTAQTLRLGLLKELTQRRVWHLQTRAEAPSWVTVLKDRQASGSISANPLHTPSPPSLPVCRHRLSGMNPNTSCISGILYGTMTMELGGKVTIACEKNKLQAELDFKLKVMDAAVGGSAWSSGREGGLIPSFHTRRSAPNKYTFASPQTGPGRERVAHRPHSGACRPKSYRPHDKRLQI